MKNKYFGFLLNFHENPVLAHGPILELEAHGPMRGDSFFLKNGPKPRLGPWDYMRGITVATNGFWYASEICVVCVPKIIFRTFRDNIFVT